MSTPFTARHIRVMAGCLLGGLASATVLAHVARQDGGGQITFKARVDLVQVDVRVTDKAGNAIEGLTADDFTIREDGHPQTISQFREVSMPLANREIDPKLLPPPRDIVVNDGPAATRAVVIVIDNLHLTTGPEELAHMKRSLTEIFRDLSPDDDVAIVFTGRSDLGVNFTNDLPSQTVVLDRIKDSMLPPGRGQAVADAHSAFHVLQNICRLLGSSAHARRAIFFISEGVSINLSDITPAARSMSEDIQAVLTAAAQSDVIIYAFNTQGPVTITNSAGAARVSLAHTFLSAFTLSTGGRVLAGETDLTKGIQGVLRENGRFYVLGYSPEPLSRDGAFHHIEVTTRNPAYQVNARQGYLAVPAADAIGGDPQRAIQTALGKAFAVRDLRLRATAAIIGPAAEGRVKTRVTLQVGPVSQTAGPPWDFRLVAVTVDGKGVATVSRTLPDATGAATPTLVQQDIDLPPGRLAVRAGVRSGTSGAIGTVQLTVDVPNISGERLSIGGLMLGHPAPAAKDANALDAFAPVVNREFRPDDLPDVMAQVFWRAKDGDHADITATIKSAAGKTVAETRATVKSDAVDALHQDLSQGTFAWHLPGAGALPAGEYRLDVEGKSSGGHASRAIPFTVK